MKVGLHVDADKPGAVLSFAEEKPPHKTFWLVLPPKASVEQASNLLEELVKTMRGHKPPKPPVKGSPTLTLVD